MMGKQCVLSIRAMVACHKAITCSGLNCRRYMGWQYGSMDGDGKMDIVELAAYFL
jgi:hypothetical protein